MFYSKNKNKCLSDELFKSPSAEYRGTPFWAWNCAVNEELLSEQIDVLKKMGFGGFHMHSRTGMAIKYLGNEFMKMVRFCVEKAKKEGMLAYLYDEDRWPSGFAGGYVTQNPQYRQRRLEFSVNKEEHFSEEESINSGRTYLLAVYDIVLNNSGELECYKRITENDTAKGQKWYAYIKTAQASKNYNNQTYVDTLNKKAIDEFIRITYDTYKEAVGDEFGETVPSIFTDEPQFVRKKPLGRAHSTDNAIFPWTPSFAEKFKCKYGYDIVEELPQIIWNLPNGEISLVRYHYHDYVTALFAESFAENCGKWCKESSIALTGHLMQEPTLISQTGSIGEAMRSYKGFEIPGIDVLKDNREYTTAKQCQSAVHQYGREAMLTELYGVTNWDYDFRSHKSQGDWQTALGATVRVPHLSLVSMGGEAKRDYPASINYQVPWCEEYKYIEDHFARINTVLTRGKPFVKVAVMHPIESYWLYFGPAEETIEKCYHLNEKFTDITKWLLFNTIDFDFVSEALLPEQKEIRNEKLYIGEMHYDTIIVPDCITLRSSTLLFLEQFVQMGGKVIFAGTCPEYVDAKKSNAVKELFDKSEKVNYDKLEIIRALEDERIIKIIGENGLPTDNLIYNMREDGDCKWLFVANAVKNENPENAHPQKIKLIIKEEYTPILYDTLDGSIQEIPYEIEMGKTVICFDFYQNDSILLKLCAPTDGKNLTENEGKAPTQTIRFNEKVDYFLSEPNVLLLDHARFSLNGGAFSEEEEILTIDDRCREALGWQSRLGATAQPWTMSDSSCDDFVELCFSFESELDVKDALLAIENVNLLTIKLNGESVHSEICGFYVDKAIKTVKLPLIKKGINTLEINHPFSQRIGLEWCYILGDFGVKAEGCNSTIIPKSEKIGFSNIVYQGMPFYGGNMIYRMSIETPECDAVIRAQYYRGALVKVRVDGKDSGRIVFAPYELKINNLSAGKHDIEFILFGTRVNTFGPMHDLQRVQTLWPKNWHTKGKDWTYEYMFKEAGILSSPVIDIYEK